jgi:hypothetical protein
MFKWLKEEFVKILPVFIFFFVAFSLVDVSAMFMHKDTATTYYSFLVVVMSALVMAKVVLISDYLSITSLFSHKPLIYVTLWKSLVYVLCSLVVRFLERAIPAFLEGKSIAEVDTRVIYEIERLPFWVAQGWLIVLFLIFVAYRELIYAVGEDKVRKLFFGK